MMISPRKSSKKLKALSDAEANAILDGEVFTGMLEEHGHIFANMVGFAKNLLEKRSLVDNSPKAIIKLMLVEGWLDNEGRICSDEGELNLLWKQIRTYNTAVSADLATNILPDHHRDRADSRHLR